MRVLLYSRFGEYPKEIEGLVESFGLEIVKENPEVVISFGGDGTLLGAERDYPEIPKLPIRNSENCHLCSVLSNEKLLAMLASKKLKVVKFIKLEAIINNQKIIALNDIIIAHKFPNLAIRFEIFGKKFIGDGLVISTPFGATGYFYSITKKTFKNGFGVAFNNLHNSNEKIKFFSKEVVVLITRGPAVLAADNDPNLLNLLPSAEILVRRAPQPARILLP